MKFEKMVNITEKEALQKNLNPAKSERLRLKDGYICLKCARKKIQLGLNG